MHVAPLVGKQQASVLNATSRINVWDGSVRSSKTISSLLWWLSYVRNGPAGNLLMAGRTERTLKRNVIDPLVEMLGTTRCRHVQGEGELHLLGRRIYLAGANDERSQEKIRGLTLAGAYLDEASTVPESFWTMLLSRLSVAGARMGATTNPDSPAHWLKKTYLDRAAFTITGDGTVIDRRAALEKAGDDGAALLDLARFQFRLDDNPTLDPVYVANLKREYVGLWYRRFILGEWVQAEGAIYETWDPERHVIDILPQMARWLCLTVDYGTVNPFAALLLGLGDDGRLYIAREWRHDSRQTRRTKTDADYSRDLRQVLDGDGDSPGWKRELQMDTDPMWVVVDPSAASFKAQLWRDGWTGITDGDNAVVDGIRLVASALSTGRLKVHSSCVGLIDEFPGYVWDDDAAEKGEDKPVKVDDHSLDALRYGVASTEHLWRPVPLREAA